MTEPRLPESTMSDRMTPLRIFFDASCNATLRLVLTEAPFFSIENDPATAEIVLFGTDEIGTVKNSSLYQQHKAKSLCITESDIPTFFLPGLYAANQKGLLNRGRTQSINYFLSERERPNPEIKRVATQALEKRYLYSFMGRTNSWTRRKVLAAPHPAGETLVEATNAYKHWVDDEDAQARAERMRQRYAEVMGASKYALCPRGCGVSSYRLFESMSLGIAPVVLADTWQPIEGMDWSFAIFLPEKRIPDVARIVRSHEAEWQARGRAAQAAYQALLQPECVARMLHAKLRDVVSIYDPRREAMMAMAAESRAAYREVYWKAYAMAKKVALKSFQIMGVASPVAQAGQ